MTNEQLREKFAKCVKVQEKTCEFLDLQQKIAKELDRRNRAILFRACVQFLKNRNFSNQFRAAAVFADAVLDDPNYFCDSASYEIGRHYTKSGNPVVVYFV